jgi:hypothetical protein
VDHGWVIGAEDGRSQFRHAGEVGPGHVTVGEFLGDEREVVREHQHQRIGVAQPDAGFEGLLEGSPRRHRIVGSHLDAGELPHGGEQFGVALGQLGPSDLDGTFEQGPRPVQVPRLGEGFGTLTGLREGGRLRHPNMLPAHRSQHHPGMPDAIASSVSKTVSCFLSSMGVSAVESFRIQGPATLGQGISPGKTGACAGHHSRLASTGPAWIDASPTIPGHSSRSPEAPDAAGAHAGHVRVLVTSWTATVRAHAAAPWTSDVVRATGESHIAIACAPAAARPAPSRVHQRRQDRQRVAGSRAEGLRLVEIPGRAGRLRCA